MDAPGTIDHEVLARLRQLVAALPGVRLVVLFGSTASGRRRAGSDVDLGVVADGSFGDADEAELARRLALAAGTEVDLVRLEAASTVLRWQVTTPTSRPRWRITARCSGAA